ncbi:putative cytosolic malate dehydrogenase [Leishmania mexicana MHOM/GT/2001/U1103]|uniref:Malate dehydrogenase n=1 Tax=Leishmania mexicana (strain MHOM/GT/2001/U1103) TaxID=929439 RepID=E9B0A8_LEIMU|nr:putative cytosolic malate dehydrogenase [Leishmania mexicana MHOM/GT/2001/U1103]CBZ28660.1 putative cytosolic malate dehydrogenase [Leishmania mexicana MHOM/GT/2001/U1103]
MSAVKVAVTGAAGQIGYALVPLIARGILLGPTTHVELRLLDIEPALKALAGVEAELDDCAFPLLDKVVITADPRVAFDGVSISIMCGAFPRRAGMERKDLLEMNARIFKEQGEAIAAVAAPDCRVLVVGNPANTNALILLKSAQGKLNPRHVTAMTRLDHNRALSLLARKAGVPVSQVRNVIIWGNHSSTQVPDIDNAVIGTTPAREAIKDGALNDDFVQLVRERGAEIIQLRGLSSAMSAAKAAVDHVHDWIHGTPEGVYVSMGVYSDGNPYGVPSDLIFSFPCTCHAGEWTVVSDKLNGDLGKQRLASTIAELQEERAQAGI